MSPARFLRDLVVVLALTGAFVWGVTRWLLIPFAVEGPSMQPTLGDGERVLVDLWTFRSRRPLAGDVVLVSGPADEDLVKRIASEPRPGADRFPPAEVPTDSPSEPAFIVLGDNAGESRDSRSFGRVPLHRIRGRVRWRYWPPSRLGTIE